MNNLYISPEFEILWVEMIEDVIMSSLEGENGNPSYDGGWNNPGDGGGGGNYDDDGLEW